MRKRLFICTIFVLLSCFHYAAAEMNSNMYVMIGNVVATEPQLEIVIADTGKHYEHGERNHILSATITAIDGSFFQQLFYNTLESPLSAPELRFARLTDVNFDGFLDLNLLVAAGAENIYTSIALWNVEAGQFDPVMTLRSGLTDETIQLELCNAWLEPESKQICSEVFNGTYNKARTVYCWVDERTLVVSSVATIYSAEGGLVGEKLEVFGKDASFGWDQQYSPQWYYGEARVEKERSETLDYIMFGNALTDPKYMQVTNVDWVNVRIEDRNESLSIAKLVAGHRVWVLCNECGSDGGWIRVCFRSENGESLQTGYIWHSYLK